MYVGLKCGYLEYEDYPNQRHVVSHIEIPIYYINKLTWVWETLVITPIILVTEREK
jgi:hypothetical protein